MSGFQNIWHEMYHMTNYGDEFGNGTKEVRFFQGSLTDCVFDWFRERQLNLDYVRREFQWYLHGDPEDLRICEHAKIWSGVVNRDKTLSSNYGWYVFTCGQLKKAVQRLKNDVHSRQAVISIYHQPTHFKPGVKDVPCTCSITFMIRKNRLHMGVHMRSNDLVFGLGNDAPCFHWFHQLAYWLLKPSYQDLKMGLHIHRADSLHIYERHFQLATQIGTGKGHWEPEDIPLIQSTKEAEALIAGDRPKTPFGKWLYGVEL